ncbi:MAG: hypothetical protein JWO31_773, partial [Phycisphaerales bacterium]|nr:hypothetical protein [Phycisphaerales bacterium]
MALVAVFYAWVVSAGRMARWPTYGTYYDQLADAFLLGQTSLPLEPDPRLLALPDPYEPGANASVRLHDALLYRGQYYLYWGPVPGALLAGGKLLFARDLTTVVGDQYLAFWFAVGTAAAAAALLWRARLRLFPGQSHRAVGLGVVVVGLAGPVPYTLARASVYEAAILGGQCFLVAGVYAAYRGLFPADRGDRTPSPGVPGPPGQRTVPSPAWLTVAGACWAAAVGCRLSLAPAVAALGLLAVGKL